MKKAYLIDNIEEYGKLISYCIENDITVFRSYWDECKKGDRCYVIDFHERRLYFSSRFYWESQGYDIVKPFFVLDLFGKYLL